MSSTLFPHLLPPSKPRSRSGSPYKPNFGSAVADVPMSNWNLDMAPGWRCSQLDSKNRAENIANLALFTSTLPLLNGTCILFPEMRPVFEQKS